MKRIMLILFIGTCLADPPLPPVDDFVQLERNGEDAFIRQAGDITPEQENALRIAFCAGYKQGGADTINNVKRIFTIGVSKRAK